MDSIQHIVRTCKALIAQYVLVLLIIFVGFSAFGLGRLSMIERGAAVIGTPESIQTATNRPELVQSSGVVVGSKNGTKYHYPWCPGAQRIRDENKVSFSSIEEAREAGYTPAGNCKGLE